VRVIGGLAKLLIATVMAGILLAGLLLPYTVGLGLAANKVTDAIDSANAASMDEPMPLRTTVDDSQGHLIAYIYDQNRTYVPLADISRNLWYATIAIEDRRFYKHKGVDWQGTVRALLQNAAGDPISGGSTITQQLVKNYLYLVAAQTPAEKADAIAQTPLRKLREAKMALMYEQNHTKDQVLEAYLNLIAFGPSTYGAEAAAEHFFGVSADKLSLAQAALMAAMINNPNKYNPLVPSQQDVTRARRDQVLDDMARDGWISQATANKTKKEDLGVTASPTPNGCIDAPNSTTNGYFCRYVLDYLANAGFDYTDLSRAGDTITTTLDPTVMADAVAAVKNNADPDSAQAKRVANVVAVVEPGVTTRKVLALAANRPYGLNQAKGQTVQRLTTTFAPLGAGSTFKIFTTAAVMDKGLGVNAAVDVPPTYTSPLAPSHVFHNEGTFAASMPISQALAESPNTAFVSLEDQVGLSKVVDMSVKLGLRGYLLDAGDVDPAFAGTGESYADEVTSQKIASYTLGVSPVSPLELSNVGATLGSDGRWCPPTPVDSITDRNGNQVTWKQQPCEQAVAPELARTLTNAMYGDMHNPDGTAYTSSQAAKWTRVSASKTGTTQDYKSSAFLGYTPYYSAAVLTWDYLNRPQPICKSPLRTCTEAQAQGGAGMSGGSVPAQTWLSLMNPLHKDKEDTPFPVSDAGYLEGQPTSQVPNVINMTLSEAKQQLIAHGFTVPTQYVSYSDKYGAAANTVVDQNPKSAALPGTPISLVVSIGQATSASPSGGG
jgi:membrane peptidoglycan carboxypeptidase